MGIMIMNTRLSMLLLIVLAVWIGQAVAAGVVNDTMCSAYSAVDSDEYW